MGALSSDAARGAPAEPPPGPDVDGDVQYRLHTLHASARPLIALATQLSRAVLEAPPGMKRALAAAVDRFERELGAAGWDQRSIAAASYVLCAWVDEVLAQTPWGGDEGTLLERFHGERAGGSRVLRLLSRLAEQPPRHQALLELLHVCLSLGLQGELRHEPDAAERLEQLRARLFQILPAGSPSTLSAPWQPAVRRPAAPWQRRAWVAALLVVGMGALAVYTAAHLRLARQVDAVFVSMHRMGAGAPGGISFRPAALPAEAAARIAPQLAADAQAGHVLVRDEPHRSIVMVSADLLFVDGGTGLGEPGRALLARIGSALAAVPGKIVVIGHTDGSDARTARVPSPWHQSFEWARLAAGALSRQVGADRVVAEGAADLDDGRPDGAARRRVDIVLHP